MRQAAVVPVASARMTCEIRLPAGRRPPGHRARRAGTRRPRAGRRIEDLLHRAIECGAMVDPWNILGFGGQFSLFPAVENTVHDHRVDELIDLMSEIFGLYVRIAQGRGRGRRRRACGKRSRAEPGRPGRVVGPVRHHRGRRVEGFSGRRGSNRPTTWPRRCGPGTRRARPPATWPSGAARRALPVAQGLCPGGRDAAGTPRPGGRHGAVDPVAQPGRGDSAGRGGLFLPRSGPGLDGRPLAERREGCRAAVTAVGATVNGRQRVPAAEPSNRRARTGGNVCPERWSLARKFLDYLEANADEYWQVPHFEMAGGTDRRDDGRAGLAEEPSRRRGRLDDEAVCSARPMKT